jgi:hypothetical protein
MKHAQWHIIFKMFVQRFYAQNSGFFLFIFVVMFGIVQTLTDSLIIEYHYHLIMGMLGNYVTFFLVLFLWLIYSLKCVQFVINIISAPNASFLNVINVLPRKNVFSLLFMLQVFLYLPVLIYSVAILGVAVFHHLYAKAVIVILFHAVSCFVIVKFYQQKVKYSGLALNNFLLHWKLNLPKPYFSFLISYLFADLKFLFFGIKIFTCLLLMAFLKNLEQNDYDFRLMMLMYTMALIGNSVIIHKIRNLEETRLAFYRQLPIPGWKRWMQYVCFYFIMMIPELIIIIRSMPLPLHHIDGTYILLFTLSLLLLQHAILSAWLMSFKHFLKLALGIFFVLYFFIVGKLLAPLIVLMFLASTFIFITRYYKFELNKKVSD